jgi:DUF971 family protein
MSQKGQTDPADIRVNREQRTLGIRWVDGHESLYPFDLLWKECPCALCNERRAKVPAPGHLSLTVLSGPVVRAGEVQAAKVVPVGRYAINFAWSDGHDSGIYSFEYLRELCPCPSCAGMRKASGGKTKPGP